MGVLTVANQRVEVAPGRKTWLEAIHQSNAAGRIMKPNSFFNEVFLGKKNGNFKPIPDEILTARPIYAGTVAAIGANGKPLGNGVETECMYENSRKTVIFKAVAAHAGLIDTAVLCDHAFAPDGTPLISLSNARTGKQIRTEEEMRAADEVIVKFNGNVYLRQILSRNGGVFEAVGDVNAASWFSYSAAIGLLWRGVDFGDDGRHGVDLVVQPSGRFGVVWEATPNGIQPASH